MQGTLRHGIGREERAGPLLLVSLKASMTQHMGYMDFSDEEEKAEEEPAVGYLELLPPRTLGWQFREFNKEGANGEVGGWRRMLIGSSSDLVLPSRLSCRRRP